MSIPHSGFHYSLLRRMETSGDWQNRISSLPCAEISFNNLGQFDALTADGPFLGMAKEVVPLGFSELQARAHPLEIVCVVNQGALSATFIFPRARYTPESMEGLAWNFLNKVQELASKRGWR